MHDFPFSRSSTGTYGPISALCDQRLERSFSPTFLHVTKQLFHGSNGLLTNGGVPMPILEERGLSNDKVLH